MILDLDPAEAWKAWRPTAAEPWGRKWAAHLYRRAAFGPSAADLDAAERAGFEKTLALLLSGRPDAPEIDESLADVGRVAAKSDDPDQLRGWWLYAMLHTAHPLREKLTLFWHNHFATSILKVRKSAVMLQQNQLLRSHALGKFGPFLHAIGKDAAMLLWLDSNSNVKGAANENYAREVMELFSLGVGNYTEKDIREAARAFTGWHTDGQGFRFNAAQHDDGPKTSFGKTGNWDGGDVVPMLLDRPSAARFLVGKLYAFLVSEVPPPPALLEPLCDSFRKSDYDIGALVKTMLSSRLFFSDRAFRQRVKGPVEYVLGATRAVYRAGGKPLPHRTLVRHVNAMGQSLFAPPNVKGWPGGRVWLNTATVLERDNFAAALSSGTLWGSGFPSRDFDPARVLDSATGAEDVVQALLDVYVPGGVRPEVRAKLVAFLGDGKPAGDELAQRVRDAAHAILTMPEYQLA